MQRVARNYEFRQIRWLSASSVLPIPSQLSSMRIKDQLADLGKLCLWRVIIHFAVPSFENLNRKVKNNPHKPRTISEVTIESLMNSGVHLGHSVETWHKNMLPFIYGRRAGIHVIDLEQTLNHLRRAMVVTQEIAKQGGTVLFVGMQPFMREILAKSAIYSKQFYVAEKWVMGSLANHKSTLQRATTGGILIQPDLIIVLDMKHSETCLQEAESVRVPTIGLCDTDCDPYLVTYPIPGNDDSTASVEMIAYLLSSAARNGYQERETLIKKFKKRS